MPLGRKNPAVQTRNVNIRKRQPEVLERLRRPEALLHINPPPLLAIFVVVVSRPVCRRRAMHVDELSVAVGRLAMLFHGLECLPRPFAKARFARDAVGVEERLDVFRAALEARIGGPVAAGVPFGFLAGERGEVDRVIVAELGDPRPRFRADLGRGGRIRVVTAFQEG